jgi:outer membrane immunogenic protein
MKKFLVAGIATAALFSAPAFASDMPVRAPVYKAAVPAPYDWSGWYLVGNVGYGWDPTDWTWVPTGFPNNSVQTDPKGWLGGVQAGVQRQWGNWVAGIELSWDGGDLKRSTVTVLNAGFNRDLSSKVDSIFMAAGRLGIANNNWLFYGKGGYANAEINLAVHRSVDQVEESHSTSRASGFVAGAGLEYAFAPNWIAGIEYDFIRLYPGDKNGLTSNGFVLQNYTGIDPEVHMVLARLSYKFGDWGKAPIVAKY